MTFRGVYREGVVVPDERVDLPEGAAVEFTRADRGKGVRKGPRMLRAGKLFGLGIWREDHSLGTASDEIARSLRQRVMRRGAHG